MGVGWGVKLTVRSFWSAAAIWLSSAVRVACA